MKIYNLIIGTFLVVSMGYVPGVAQEAETDRIRRQQEAFERDPEAFMDSLRRIRERELQREAALGLERYKANTRLDTFKVINLSHAQLKEIPDFVFSATNLEKLIISNNSIHKLPGRLRKLDKLTTIVWNETSADRSRKIARLPTVVRLEMIQHGISDIRGIKRLRNMTRLDLSQNEFTSIPVRRLRKNRNLVELVMKGNPLILESSPYHKLKELRVLKLNACRLTSIPHELYAIPNLKELQLQENELVAIPDGISSMDSLSKLSLYKNQLKTLPDDLFDVPNLVIIDLYYNELERIPAEIARADKLEILFLAHNRLFDLPDEIGELQRLQQLYLHHNRFSVLPERIKELSRLRTLRINDNYLSYFPGSILHLSRLQDLDVDNNDIPSIPAEISSLTELKLFTFDDNPIDYQDPSNTAFMDAIVAMLERGVVCKPAISKEQLAEEDLSN